MFIYNLQTLLDNIASKTPESIPIAALFYSLIPDVRFGYPEGSSGEFNTEEEYNQLIWLDERTKPTWAELNAHRTALFETELALDLNNLREYRYRETPLEFDNRKYPVSPNAVALLDSQIKLAETMGNLSIHFLSANYQVIELTVEKANELLLALRVKLNQWIIDPRIS